MDYEEYRAFVITNDEAMRDTHRHQADEHRELQDMINKRRHDAKQRYHDELTVLSGIERDRAKAISEKYKTERMRLYLERAKVHDQWKQEHGIENAPAYVELPNKGGSE